MKDLTIKILDNSSGTQLFGLGSLSEQYMSGLYKLVVQWAKCLLTEPHTNPVSPLYGTAFGSLITSNVNSADIRDVVILSVESATEQVKKSQEGKNLDDTERLSSARILNLSISASSLTVTVEVTNVAGESLYVTLPSNLSE